MVERPRASFSGAKEVVDLQTDLELFDLGWVSQAAGRVLEQGKTLTERERLQLDDVASDGKHSRSMRLRALETLAVDALLSSGLHPPSPYLHHSPIFH